MRIGTWNLAGRWSAQHKRLLQDEDCDVWLLTEVPAALDLGGHLHSSAPMHTIENRRWAAVWTREPHAPAESPHPAAAAVRLGDVLICSCVLPWRGARPHWPDAGENTAAITIAALGRLQPMLAAGRPVIWGGDWNHAMAGEETAGSMAGRRVIESVAAGIGLAVTTVDLPHRIEGLFSIDHIAVPATWVPARSRRVDAEADGARLSDHDAYVTDVERPPP